MATSAEIENERNQAVAAYHAAAIDLAQAKATGDRDRIGHARVTYTSAIARLALAKATARAAPGRPATPGGTRAERVRDVRREAKTVIRRARDREAAELERIGVEDAKRGSLERLRDRKHRELDNAMRRAETGGERDRITAEIAALYDDGEAPARRETTAQLIAMARQARIAAFHMHAAELRERAPEDAWGAWRAVADREDAAPRELEDALMALAERSVS